MTHAPRWPGWLLLRRLVQCGVLAAFAGAPWGWGWEWGWVTSGERWVQGTLASSVWFGVVPLTDPFVLLQSLLAVSSFATVSWTDARVVGAGLVGALLIALPFMLLNGRLYCAWVCPINMVSDFAELLRRVTGWRGSLWAKPDRRLRYVVLVLALAASALTGAMVWEAINPITTSVRAVAFGLWASGAAAVAAVLLIDLLLLRHGWCGHVCPVGAFYALLGRFGRLHVSATRVDRCTSCGDCYARCPEPHVIVPVLPKASHEVTPMPKSTPKAMPTTMRIADTDCLRCGRCIDVCPEGVFEMRLFAARPHPT